MSRLLLYFLHYSEMNTHSYMPFLFSIDFVSLVSVLLEWLHYSEMNTHSYMPFLFSIDFLCHLFLCFLNGYTIVR